MSEIKPVETRGAARQVEIREAKEPGKPSTIVGYAAVFNAESEDIGFREYIAPGAFKRSLDTNRDVLALVEHDRSMIIGRRSAGTLRLEEDSTGLRYEVDVPDTQVGRDLLTNIRSGNIKGSSFGFRAIKDRWEFNHEDYSKDKRTLLELELYDVGPVAEPAYADTSVAARSRAEARSRQGTRSQDPAKTDPNAAAPGADAKPGEPQAGDAPKEKPKDPAKTDPNAAPAPEQLTPDESLDLSMRIEAVH